MNEFIYLKISNEKRRRNISMGMYLVMLASVSVTRRHYLWAGNLGSDSTMDMLYYRQKTILSLLLYNHTFLIIAAYYQLFRNKQDIVENVAVSQRNTISCDMFKLIISTTTFSILHNVAIERHNGLWNMEY